MTNANKFALPAGFREGHDGDVACPHRDVSCCAACASSDFLFEVWGQHYHAPQGREAAIAELGGPQKGLS